MYSASPSGVNVAAAALVTVLWAGQPLDAQIGPNRAAPACDPAFARLFAPAHPRIGLPPLARPGWTSRYDVCPSTEPLSTLAGADWTVEAVSPLDAFGSAGAYDRAALVRLYHGQRVRVARGWREAAGQFESITLVSPYPDSTLARLEPGTLIIRLILCCT